MAGTILLSGNEGLATSTLEFDYFVDRIRTGFASQDEAVAAAVYEPLDEGGMTFISAADLDQAGYKAFAGAVKRAYEASIPEPSFPRHKDRWLELLGMIERDSRSGFAPS
jgi:hypothetical protein